MTHLIECGACEIETQFECDCSLSEYDDTPEECFDYEIIPGDICVKVFPDRVEMKRDDFAEILRFWKERYAKPS